MCGSFFLCTFLYLSVTAGPPPLCYVPGALVSHVCVSSCGVSVDSRVSGSRFPGPPPALPHNLAWASALWP